MSNTEKQENTHAHRKLPSFTELIESFPKGQESSDNVSEESRQIFESRMMHPSISHSPKSSIESVSSQSGLERIVHNRPQDSDVYIEQPKNFKFPSYTYGNLPKRVQDISYSEQFNFPAAPQSDQRGHTHRRHQSMDSRGVQHHQRSTSMPWRGSKAARNNKTDLLFKISRTFSNIGDINNRLGPIKEEVVKLVEENQPHDSILRDNMIDISFPGFPGLPGLPGVTQLTESSVDRFISRISGPPLNSLARITAETNELITSLAMGFHYPMDIERQPVSAESSSSHLPLNPTFSRPPQHQLPRFISSSGRLEKKRHKSQFHSASGATIDLDVKSQAIDESSVLMRGGLNTELSTRPNVFCTHCRSKTTPEWRRGPDGSRTLCNACGLFYSKLIRRFGLVEANKVMQQRKSAGHTTDRRIN